MTWRQVIGSPLPRVARRAGAHTIARLAERLEALVGDEEGDQAPEVTLARLVPVLTAELFRVEQVVEELHETLALARIGGLEVTGVEEEAHVIRGILA